MTATNFLFKYSVLNEPKYNISVSKIQKSNFYFGNF